MIHCKITMMYSETEQRDINVEDTNIIRRWQAGFEPQVSYTNNTSPHPSPVLQTPDTHIRPAQNLCRCRSHWVPGPLPPAPRWSPDPPHPLTSAQTPLEGSQAPRVSQHLPCKRLCIKALTEETCWLCVLV